MDSVHLLGQGSPIGILSRPDGEHRSHELAVLFLNSGLLHRVGPFRLYVQLARRLAAAGIPALRIDQSGKGDSARRNVTFEESLRRDFEAAAAFLAAEIGTKRLVVLGLCSGADDGLFLLSEYPEIEGAVLLEAYASRTPRYYVRHYGPRLFRPHIWAMWAARVARILRTPGAGAGRRRDGKGQAPDMGAIREFGGDREIRRRYETVIRSGRRILCVFTSGARRYYNYPGQLVESLNLERGSELITEVYFPEAKHTYPLVGHRERLMDEVYEWVIRKFGDGAARLGSEDSPGPPQASADAVERGDDRHRQRVALTRGLRAGG